MFAQIAGLFILAILCLAGSYAAYGHGDNTVSMIFFVLAIVCIGVNVVFSFFVMRATRDDHE